MDLIETLRGTGAVRAFRDEPVDHAVLHRVLDTARFAPNGGNQQAWHVVVVDDPSTRAALRDLYLEGWAEYLALRAAGLRPWAPITDRDAEAAVIAEVRAATDHGDLGDFATHFDRVPAMLVLLADLRGLAAGRGAGSRSTDLDGMGEPAEAGFVAAGPRGAVSTAGRSRRPADRWYNTRRSAPGCGAARRLGAVSGGQSRADGERAGGRATPDLRRLARGGRGPNRHAARLGQPAARPRRPHLHRPA